MIEIQIRKKLQFAGGKGELTINTVLPGNAITAIYGSSGSGKTTLLKILAGLVKPDSGIIRIGGDNWYDSARHIDVSPQKRNAGFVFQDYALFPNMSLLENLQYAGGKERDETFIHHLIREASLQSFLHTKPQQLSGGQQQRVALIRALVRKPDLLLLDEPLSAVGTQMRKALYSLLLRLQADMQFTALLVSHDVSDVYSLAKHMICLEGGKVKFEGSPQQMFGGGNRLNAIQLTAEVLTIVPNGVIYIVELLAGNDSIIRLTATADEIKDIESGDKVILHSNAAHAGFSLIR